MVGWIPFLTLQVEPRVSYYMYIPRAHYHRPSVSSGSHKESLSLIVSVHGTERPAERCCFFLSELADREPLCRPGAAVSGLHRRALGPRQRQDAQVRLHAASTCFCWPCWNEVKARVGTSANSPRTRFLHNGILGAEVNSAHRFLYLPTRTPTWCEPSVAPGRPIDFLDHESAVAAGNG